MNQTSRPPLPPRRLGIRRLVVLKNIRHFVAAAEAGSFHKAADRLGIVQSALSRRLGELEEELGGRLFDRLPSGVVLTEGGRSLYEDARRLLDDLDRSIQRFEMIENGSVALLRVGINGAAMMHAALALGLHEFRRACPKVEVRLTPLLSEAQFAALAAGVIDIGVAFDFSQPHMMSVRHLATDHLTLAIPARHALATKPRLTIADLNDADLIGVERANSGLMAELVDSQLRNAGVSVHTVMEAGNTETALSLVAGGLGVGFVNHSQKGREPPGVVLRDVEDFFVPLPLYMYWPPTAETAALRHFVEIVAKGFES